MCSSTANTLILSWDLSKWNLGDISYYIIIVINLSGWILQLWNHKFIYNTQHAKLFDPSTVMGHKVFFKKPLVYRLFFLKKNFNINQEAHTNI